ncbi:hypothetical protein HaLaN_16489 [Haematococcus lacustris]|uniref:Uncharacterized protein n=1 Tax=Haematococcus lacustris TaxID=44745 RepID=A0A699ZUC3_HAELA|nr:hypothetical protein HaLaN_16489 [Haematococcus lacustris]
MHEAVTRQFKLLALYLPWFPLDVAEHLLSEMVTAGVARHVGVRITGQLGLRPGWETWGPYCGLVVDWCKRQGVDVVSAFVTFNLSDQQLKWVGGRFGVPQRLRECERWARSLQPRRWRSGRSRLAVRRLICRPHRGTNSYRKEWWQLGGEAGWSVRGPGRRRLAVRRLICRPHRGTNSYRQEWWQLGGEAGWSVRGPRRSRLAVRRLICRPHRGTNSYRQEWWQLGGEAHWPESGR